MKKDFQCESSKLAFKLFSKTGEIGAFMLFHDLENLDMTKQYDEPEREM